jgi:hypothetical protein
MMWQKLNALDILHLEKARIQLLNAVQLVSAVPRSFGVESIACFPKWNQQTAQFSCNVSSDTENIQVSIDIKDLVLTLSGESRHAEHLVLSGITYPMAFGWMQIKLDSFGLKGGQFNDTTSYKLEKTMGADEEMIIIDQQVFDDIAIYYSNAAFMLQKVSELPGHKGLLRINPSDINMVLLPENPESYLIPGFSIGSRFYPEPHFFIQLTTSDQAIIKDYDARGYLWRNKDWLGLLLPAVDFLSHDEDDEFNKVMNFFTNGLR